RILSTRSPARRHRSGKFGPYAIRPPASTNSRTPCIIGSRAASANVLIRTLLVVTSGSAQTYKASARPLSASKAGTISSAQDFQCDALEAERVGRCLSLGHLEHGGGIASISHDRQPAKTGHNLAQEFDSLAGKIGKLSRQAGNVAAGSRQTGDQAGAH